MRLLPLYIFSVNYCAPRDASIAKPTVASDKDLSFPLLWRFTIAVAIDDDNC